MRLASGLVALGLTFATHSPAPARPALPPIQFNDNLRSAGTLAHDELTVSLVAEAGRWLPFGAKPGIPMLAFAEAGKAPQDPGPMLRVARGTRLAVHVQNLTGAILVVHGLSARRVTVLDSLVVAPGATAVARFTADAEGTYYYWATTHGEDFAHRELDDAHLDGALIVDPPQVTPPADRVFVVEWYMPDTLADGTADFAHMLFTINGRPWPFTERLSYDVGDSVRWRLINTTDDVHPFHMHGFFYRVDARGDFRRDTIYWPGQQRHVVTEAMWPGTTMDLAWRPDRPGGWIFHCHFNFHVVPNSPFPPDTEPTAVRDGHLLRGYPGMTAMNHATTGMGGLVMAIYVRPPPGWHPYTGARRTLRLLVQRTPRSGDTPGDSVRRYEYILDDGGRKTLGDPTGTIGPPIILRRGQPTRIWIVDHTPEMTQVHWHGLEIESGADGVAGISGVAGAMEPAIMPGDSLAVLVTPPRAGSFMYHTHINDIYQQTHGLYGPLIVLDSGATWNPDSDRFFMVGDGPNVTPVLNGSNAPAPIDLVTGVRHRFRLMNITVVNPGLRFRLVRNGVPMKWVPLAKDGYATPPWQRDRARAVQAVNIGETYDFGVTTARPGTAALELRTLVGKLIARQVIRFVK